MRVKKIIKIASQFLLLNSSAHIHYNHIKHTNMNIASMSINSDFMKIELKETLRYSMKFTFCFVNMKLKIEL